MIEVLVQEPGAASPIAVEVYSGRSPGLSAYAVAMANGFVGTESAWLTSLEGAQGAPGTEGPPGTDGVGVPAGGTTGQALVKTSDVDLATGWGTFSPTDHTHLRGTYSVLVEVGEWGNVVRPVDAPLTHGVIWSAFEIPPETNPTATNDLIANISGSPW